MKEDIEPKNSKRQRHGYHEWYSCNDDSIMLRVKYLNGNEIGYEEFHEIKETTFYIR